jgi:hypothetical protein
MAKRTDHQIAIDDALTKSLCSSERIYNFMVRSATTLSKKFSGKPDVFFYVKGSAALARYLELGGISKDLIEKFCARSDWDTQLVINPLLPAQDWFTAYSAAQKEIVDLLKAFEGELLIELAELLPGNRQSIDELNNDPVRLNALAKRVRTQLAVPFAEVFLDTCRREHFHQKGHHKYWDLQWDNINKLDTDDTRKDILDLEIQAHNRAVLTWALIHPAQTLANLNSVMPPADLRDLQDAADVAAAKLWAEREGAANEYETLQRDFIRTNKAVAKLLRDKLAEESFADPAFIRSLPVEAFNGVIKLMPEQEQQQLNLLWQQAQDARAQDEVAMQTDDADVNTEDKKTGNTGASAIKFMSEFVWRVVAELKNNPQANKWLSDWCEHVYFADNAQLAAFADQYYDEISGLLTADETLRLQAIEDRMDQQFEEYHEDLDPEKKDAETQKQGIERFSPFTLDEQQKGSRRAGTILENLTIRDFYLYRLMIKCQLSNRDMKETERLIPQTPNGMAYDVYKQQFKFRAELLDISIPRNDTLETAEQWARVRNQITVDPDGIPLPKGDYFIDEYMLMFREVLDKKSSSAHKFVKRLWRACLIAEAFANELKQTGQLGPRMTAVTETFPTLKGLEKLNPPGAVVIMRMCEQLIESYELRADEKLGADTAIMINAMGQEIQSLLSNPLTHKTFLRLMEMFAHLGRSVYQHTWLVTDYRRAIYSDDQLASHAATARNAIAQAFEQAKQPYRCAVVEDFAIRSNPELPDDLKQSMPLRSAKITVYTTKAGAGVLTQLPDIVRALFPKAISPEQPVQDVVVKGDMIYVSLLVQPPKQHQTMPGSTVVMTIQAVTDDNQTNWYAPRYAQDIRGTLDHYRRTMPKYSEFYMQNQKKQILHKLEIALTSH